MTHRILNEETVRKILKKADEALPKLKPLFSEEANKLIKKAVESRHTVLSVDGRKFRLVYNRRKGVDWVRMNPVTGYTPMFNAEVSWVLDKEKEI